MPRSSSPSLSPRKKPRQARSEQMVGDILEGSLRVLRREGGRGFTTARVAEEAGVSVGSVYQYFPNKESLLFRLQTDEWARTAGALSAILERDDLPHEARLRQAVVAFFFTERDEAELRRALGPSQIRAAPQAAAHEQTMLARLTSFFAGALPARDAGEIASLSRFVATSLAALAERVTEQPLSDHELEAWAAMAADLHGRHLAALSLEPGPPLSRLPSRPA